LGFIAWDAIEGCNPFHPGRKERHRFHNEGRQSMPTKTTRKIYRRADTGQFTSEKWAKKHPKNTIKGTVKVVPQKKQPVKIKKK
jgi:hypothetical protein